MAVDTFYPQAALASGSNHLAMQDGGTGPAIIALLSPNTGWNPGTTAPPRFCVMDSQLEVASTSADWVGTLPARSVPNNTRGDSFRTPATRNGSYAAGSWSFGIRLGGGFFNGRFQLRFRVWRSASADGAGATEVTTSDIIVGPTTANISATVTALITGTWSAPALSLANEYLFFQIIFDLTQVPGGATQDANIYEGADVNVTTTEFTPSGGGGTPAIMESVGMILG